MGFGCGRLRAGLEERNSRRLIDAALDCGIRYFDTAPSYGDGASERVLGLCLRQMWAQVAICTKIGFPRSNANAAVAAARALLRAAVKPIQRRLVRRARAAQAPAGKAPAGPAVHGRFDAASLHADVQASLEALQTDRVDCLMLHEPRLTDPTPDLSAALRGLVTAGTAVRIGVGTGSAIEMLPRYGDVAQAVLTPSLLNGEDSRALIVHGLFRGFREQDIERCAAEAGLLDSIPSLRRLLRSEAGPSALLMNCALLGSRVERLLWSTSSVTRLRRVLAAAEGVHDEIRGAWSIEREAKLADTMRRYAYGAQAAR
jgi:hypothetical protein